MRTLVLVRALAVFSLLLLFACVGNKPSAPANKISRIILPDGVPVSVEIADTDEARALGLMNRSSLCYECGMLFIFGREGAYPFWMENMRFPIDIIFLDSNFRVVDIFAGAPPCVGECSVYTPRQSARYVLEINANETVAHKIVIGSELRAE